MKIEKVVRNMLKSKFGDEALLTLSPAPRLKEIN